MLANIQLINPNPNFDFTRQTLHLLIQRPQRVKLTLTSTTGIIDLPVKACKII
jgi:hypothetical protein